MTLTIERLRELLHYDPETGIFTHRIGRKGQSTRAGEIAGRIRAQDGHRRIGIDYGRYFASRLAWLYMTGEWPESEIDHINRIPNDDRFANLRVATRGENQANRGRPQNNTSGLKGVNRHKGRWRAFIKKNGVNIHLGYFPSANAAHEAYVAKAQELFGEFATERGI